MMSKNDDTVNLLDKDYTYAVVGASKDESKYGHKVLRELKEAGLKAIPVNPHEKEILGLKAYKSISEVKEKIDVAVFVVPGKVTEKVLEEVKEKDIDKVWLQPGSGTEKAISFCKDNNITCVHDTCIMIQKDLIDEMS